MPTSKAELVKRILPDVIVRTPRDTFIYQMDGEDQIYPSYREAATALAKEIGLGKTPLTAEDIKRHLGDNVKVVYTNLEAMAKASGAPVPTRRQRRAAATPQSPTMEPERRRTKGRQQRSIAVELPQSAVTELLRSGRAKVMLRVKAR